VERAERVAGALYGLLVGDALGVPYEFHEAAELPPRAQLEMTPPAGFTRAHASTPPGTWSDDGAQALCLLASLLHAGALDVDDLGRRLIHWYRHGYLAVDGNVFDVGNQTYRAIARLESGIPAATAGPAGERDNGNGSLMRVLPLALWHRGSDAELARDAERQSAVTHGHRRSTLCNALYVLWVRRVLGGEAIAAAWDGAATALRAIVASEPDAVAELEQEILPARTARGSGYVVDSLWSARAAALAGDYETAMKAAIAIGDDTDTTAAIAGGVAGGAGGLAAIPTRWLDALRERRETVEPLLADLLARP
jgi:ADP-ribosyl-[dinitrogen reductase] hydrolase